MSDYPRPNPIASTESLFAKLDAEAKAKANAFVDLDQAASEGRVIVEEAPEESIPNIHKILRSPTLDLAALEEELALGNVNVRSPRGKTPLMTASYYGHKQALSLLIEKGAVINAIHESTGDTAAHFVVLSLLGNIRQSGCIMILIENGATLDKKNDDGYSVYELARKMGNKEIGGTGDALMHS